MDAVSSTTTSSGPAVLGRVVLALILREVHTIYGNTNLGYLWAIITTAFSIAVFWCFRLVMGSRMPQQMSMLLFLICGMVVVQMITGIISSCMNAVRGNRPLLTFPQVTELDLMFGRTIVIWGTKILSAFILLVIGAIFFDQEYEIRRPEALFAGLLVAPLLGLGLGMCLASLARMWPTLERIVPMTMRILFFASGTFYAIGELPSRVANILLYNPLAQVVEWQRYCFTASCALPVFSLPYLFAWCGGTICLGLLLERHVRGKPLQ